jgi:predicted nuclease of restriction endonuclease-like RecB superfamily
MLPSLLLRVRTRKGTIFPLFCTGEKGDLQLAEELIRQFNQSIQHHEKKKSLEKRIATVEGQYDDYKLVRGLSTLLERRCQFSIFDNGSAGDMADPVSVRKALFEESSRISLALTEFDRDKVIDTVASKMNLSTSYIRQVMWTDLEENMILEQFSSLDPNELLGWYNLSLMQTLLFNCTKLEFCVHGGVNWKHVLRDVKRLGLMYNLQHNKVRNEQRSNNNSIDSNNTDAASTVTYNDTDETELVCSLDGPISLFKLTDRYGTSIAKLLPSIISSEKWSLNSWIVRKTMSGKKIYEFNISSLEVPSLLIDPYSSNNRLVSYFDSSVEEKFANRFEQVANGWRLIREPDPLIVTGGRAFIPDFMFQKYDRKIYLEIIGFWTREYLEKKIQKLIDIVSNQNIDLFIAVNEELACSKIIPHSTNSQERIIVYKNDSVPVKALLNYLKTIDREQTERHANNPNLKIKFDGKQNIISIDEIASKYNIPIESAITIASRDNNNEYLKAGPYFVSKFKIHELVTLLGGTTKFIDACSIFSENSIPEPCYADLISKMGYDVIWQSMDSDDARIAKRK